ncbi:HNH endonuclease signature motif containing protein [Corynebacterium pacaense]|uniref:HNH endonuclease signature motif containing protein n=1 Tax=Corynebacterium pacaense TaxID=1816684 RepID=UPI0009BBFFFA|nr:DUF222 domain-containing protein [Corynebacterium pacaense]
MEENGIAEMVKAIGSAMTGIMDVFTVEPSGADFAGNIDALVAFEGIVNSKALIDAGVTRAAQLAGAGALVGSSNHLDFLMKRFGISRAEAHRRNRLADDLFPLPGPEFEPGSESEPGPEADPRGEGDTGRKGRGEPDGGREAREAREKAEQERREALKKARKEATSAEKLNIINQELGNLNRKTVPTKEELYKKAVEESASRSPEDLRAWVRKQVTRANRSSGDPFAASRKRFLHLADQDADGGVRFSGYLPADAAAMLQAALAPLTRRGDLVEVPADEDTRTMGQRRIDGLTHILGLAHSGLLARGRHGIGSIVISMTAGDIADLEEEGARHRYPTNTGIALAPHEILRLGAAKFDFGAVLDDRSGRPLYLGRTRRSASLEQRIALLASELVCSAPGCDQPMIRCEIHHLTPWAQGGGTDISNLTPQCFGHHPAVDDSRSGVNNKGFMDVDPESGRVGHYPAGGGVVFNESAAQEESGGARARARQKESEETPGQPPGQPPGEPPDDGALFKMPA